MGRREMNQGKQAKICSIVSVSLNSRQPCDPPQYVPNFRCIVGVHTLRI